MRQVYFVTLRMGSHFLKINIGNDMPAVIEINMKNMVNPFENMESMSSILLTASFSINIKFMTDNTVSYAK